ncbi:DUF4897 domain-containing protein [Halorientalis litorea]|uniref:DUF4897 domain-containing protein n=1 Tax=Halorientalis litorea TaxID=2931977 RepID=UPI001FF26F2F|nr:DUF4897 domain-containing protein [Halorientalis litorea]
MFDTDHAVAGIVVTALLLAAVGPVGAATQETPTEGVDIALDANGTAEVTLVLTYDLGSETERDAFRDLADDRATKERFTEQFRTRMSRVARDAANETGREMRVTDASLSTRTAENTGVVELSVTWEGLAAVTDDDVTVTEPFASGFESDRPVRVVAPDGYELTSVTPEPTARDDATATWEAGTTLSGFEVVATPTTDASSGGGSGFGIAAAPLSLVALAALARRRR